MCFLTFSLLGCFEKLSGLGVGGAAQITSAGSTGGNGGAGFFGNGGDYYVSDPPASWSRGLHGGYGVCPGGFGGGGGATGTYSGTDRFSAGGGGGYSGIVCCLARSLFEFSMSLSRHQRTTDSSLEDICVDSGLLAAAFTQKTSPRDLKK